MNGTKRVTVIAELVDLRGRVIWSHTETAENTSGDNPLFHANDFRVALDEAGDEAVSAIKHRFEITRRVSR